MRREAIFLALMYKINKAGLICVLAEVGAGWQAEGGGEESTCDSHTHTHTHPQGGDGALAPHSVEQNEAVGMIHG